jgi:nucleotide-binding universal stress UspA family protein
MNKEIICTIDFSDSSREALKWSVSLAALLKSHLTILYTYRLLNSHNGEAVQAKKKIEENAFLKFAELKKDVLEGHDIAYDFRVEVGFVSNRIRHYANLNGVSFLVMGNTMNSTNKESFDELAQSLQVPLVIIP